LIRLRSPSLFWRTLILVLLLIIASLAAWLQSYRVLERGPRAQTIAQQIVSIVNITRAALVYSDPFVRGDLLTELAANEGVRIYPLEPEDKVVPLPEGSLMKLVEQTIIDKLGADTRLASRVNDITGLWVSLSIADDDYWVYINRNPAARTYGTQWIGWAGVALLLSVLGAVLITRLINRPLAELSAASKRLGSGHLPVPLPETGPVEIRTVNESFNRMVADLSKLDADRAVLMAGISHDLRTPLSRLRLELEMAQLPNSVRAAMVADIEQMDAIVRQFLDYARQAPQAPAEDVDLTAAVAGAVARARIDAEPDSHVDLKLTPGIRVRGYPIEIGRALDNLLTNVVRYGRNPQSGELHVAVAVAADGPHAVVSVIDQGPGISSEHIDRLMRPFERGESARSGVPGAGLGLPIVERIARMHGGELRLSMHLPHGLRAELRLPRA
jgi:two-component system, OmpR family, osmolarity sensor histidine kinase EnvZ